MLKGKETKEAYLRHFSQERNMVSTGSGADHVWPKLL